ncbi:heat shock protein 83-like [Diachasmimorpha longicaudata]|uniref:heat shock protein 83-like n=1 Tax=Diachasmimorpha longicaudata TaxID=58733 RepID=UPI0030B8D111
MPDKEMTADSGQVETFTFDREIAQLINLFGHMFYTNQELFLREMLYYISEVLDKIVYGSGTHLTRFDLKKELEIKIIPNKKDRTLTFIDNGYGMTKEDLVENLGRSAKLEAKEFIEKIQPGADLFMVSDYELSFYTAYVVADKVTVVTKHKDDKQYVWEASSGSSFTIRPDNGEPLSRGTKIILHMKEEFIDYLEPPKIKKVVKRYSHVITYTIKLLVEKKRDRELDGGGEELPATDTEEKEYSKYKIEEIGDEDDDDLEEKMKWKKMKETHAIEGESNRTKPLWARNPDEITVNQYKELYKVLTNDCEDYMGLKHISVDGPLGFQAVLFIPKRLRYHATRTNKNPGVKLFVRRVFVMDTWDSFLPEYLNFVKGVIDSEDLSGTITCEMLNRNRTRMAIRQILVDKCLDLFDEIAENEESFNKFYSEYSVDLKNGIHEDPMNRARLSNLLRFHTSFTGENRCSFKDYVGRMKENQKYIYYIIGESREHIINSESVESVLQRGLEIIYLTAALDEYTMQAIQEFNGIQLMSVCQEGLVLPLTEEEEKKIQEDKIKFEKLCRVMKKILDEKVEKVVISNRLVGSPCCITTPQDEWTLNMERVMNSRRLLGKKHLEINPDDSIIEKFRQKVEVDEDDKTVRDLVLLMFETAIMASDLLLENPQANISRTHRMIQFALGLEVYMEESEVQMDERTLDDTYDSDDDMDDSF